MSTALVIRGLTIVITLVLARHARVCRWAALGGSMIASAITIAVAVRVILWGNWSPVYCSATRHPASCSVRRDAVVRVVCHGAGPDCRPGRAVQRRIFRACRCVVLHGDGRRGVQCARWARSRFVAADRVIAFSLAGIMNLVTVGAGRDGTSGSARARRARSSTWSCPTSAPRWSSASRLSWKIWLSSFATPLAGSVASGPRVTGYSYCSSSDSG